MKLRDLCPDVWEGMPLKLKNMYDSKNLKATLNGKVTAQTVTIKNNSTGEIIGKRTIYQKQ